MIVIELVEDGLELGGLPVEGVLTDALLELVEVDGSTVVIISDLELAAQASNAARATGLEGLSKHIHKSINVVQLGGKNWLLLDLVHGGRGGYEAGLESQNTDNSVGPFLSEVRKGRLYLE